MQKVIIVKELSKPDPKDAYKEIEPKKLNEALNNGWEIKETTVLNIGKQEYCTIAYILEKKSRSNITASEIKDHTIESKGGKNTPW